MDVLDPALSSASRPRRTIGANAEVGSQAGCEDRGRGSPPQRSLVPAESAGVQDPAPGSGVDGAGDASGWSLRRFRERVLRVASRGVASGRRLIFVISQGATDWKRLWKRLGASVLGAGIVGEGGIGPVEGT